MARVAEIEIRLTAHDRDPLVDLETRDLWRLEAGLRSAGIWVKNRLFSMQHVSPADNVVSSDWGYLLDTDPASSIKGGQAQSNAICLGRGRVGGHDNDHGHGYPYRSEKVDEVYLRRHGVFGHSRPSRS